MPRARLRKLELLRTHENLTARQLRREIALTRLFVTITLGAGVLLAGDVSRVLLERIAAGRAGAACEQAGFIAIVAFLLYGNLVYQASRLGFLQRLVAHRRAPPEPFEPLRGAGEASALAILIPSYREEIRVVEQALMAAALQDHPDRRVVLLIDDPPDPDDPAAAEALRATRKLPRELSDLFAKPAARFRDSLESFLARLEAGCLDLREEARTASRLHAEAAAWLEGRAAGHPQRDHTDRLFAELVLRAPARKHLGLMRRLELAVDAGELPDADELLRGHRLLASLFDVEITSFERKRYRNLSREPNKAMNLNSYIGLLGGDFGEVQREDGLYLEPVSGSAADLSVPAADYLVTLDADSLIAHDYARRLVGLMEAPGNERLAVAQTPYSAIPDAPGVVERIAGATTDLQYVVHQGFTRFGASFWVGANAVLRRSALEDTKSVRKERGFPVPVFVPDRTAIEDTEASIDLIARGWSLYNHPERLAYSATPPDFGALVIQRRRWADGGLLILPKLLRHLLPRFWHPRAIAETWVRSHYLASIGGVNLGLLMFLVWPFEQSIRTWWFPVAALPYFALYARDLALSGYRRGDFLRAYALNLLLLPVNLGGVARSLRQAVTGTRASFGRTPKVSDRTPVPRLYLLAPCALLIGVLAVLGIDVARGNWLHGLFVVVNGGLLLYAVDRFIGARAILEDLRLRPREQPWTASH